MSDISRYVDFHNGADFKVALMGILGFSTKFIMEKTRLTSCQINYRLKKAKIRRVDYRNGENKISGIILNSAEQKCVQELKYHLRSQKLLENKDE